MIRNKEEQIFASVDAREEALTALSREIWEYAEPGLKEMKSSRAIAKFLEAEGFRVELGVGSIPTAIRAEYGSGRPVIAYLGARNIKRRRLTSFRGTTLVGVQQRPLK